MRTVLRSRSGEVVISADRPFTVIGERINPSGRKLLTAELREGRLDRVRADAAAQVRAGAHVLDVNAGVPGVDEPALLAAAIRAVQEVADVPICIDSSVVEALEAALPICRGRPLVNSVTGENERLDRVLPLVKEHGAAVIGIACDETGISAVPEERLAIAARIVQRAAGHGIPAEDVVIDPIAMPVAADPLAALVTLRTMRLIRKELGANMTCGASNVSFGLPDRAAADAAFLPLAMDAGLTSAITNPLEPLVRQAVLAGDLLLGHDEHAVRWIADYRRRLAIRNSGPWQGHPRPEVGG